MTDAIGCGSERLLRCWPRVRSCRRSARRPARPRQPPPSRRAPRLRPPRRHRARARLRDPARARPPAHHARRRCSNRITCSRTKRSPLVDEHRRRSSIFGAIPRRPAVSPRSLPRRTASASSNTRSIVDRRLIVRRTDTTATGLRRRGRRRSRRPSSTVTVEGAISRDTPSLIAGARRRRRADRALARAGRRLLRRDRLQHRSAARRHVSAAGRARRRARTARSAATVRCWPPSSSTTARRCRPCASRRPTASRAITTSRADR